MQGLKELGVCIGSGMGGVPQAGYGGQPYMQQVNCLPAFHLSEWGERRAA